MVIDTASSARGAPGCSTPWRERAAAQACAPQQRRANAAHSRAWLRVAPPTGYALAEPLALEAVSIENRGIIARNIAWRLADGRDQLFVASSVVAQLVVV
ncbi:MAG: hypothetical protein ACREBD_14855 [Blastocatellia bacterium]